MYEGCFPAGAGDVSLAAGLATRSEWITEITQRKFLGISFLPPKQNGLAFQFERYIFSYEDT